MNFRFSLSVAASDFKKKGAFVQLFPRPGPDDLYIWFLSFRKSCRKKMKIVWSGGLVNDQCTFVWFLMGASIWSARVLENFIQSEIHIKIDIWDDRILDDQEYVVQGEDEQGHFILLPYCHTRLHLGFSAKLRIWQVSACNMEPLSGISFVQDQPDTADPTTRRNFTDGRCFFKLQFFWGIVYW